MGPELLKMLHDFKSAMDDAREFQKQENERKEEEEGPESRIYDTPVIVVRGSGIAKVFEQDVIRIGKLASSQLRIESARRMHAVIERRGSVFWLIDLGTNMGTAVNGEVVDKNRELRHGDCLRIADCELEVGIFEAGVPVPVPEPKTTPESKKTMQEEISDDDVYTRARTAIVLLERSLRKVFPQSDGLVAESIKHLQVARALLTEAKTENEVKIEEMMKRVLQSRQGGKVVEADIRKLLGLD